MRAFVLALLALASGGAALARTGASGQPDIALIIIDDIGVERIAAYAEHPDAGPTPNIDRLAESGVLFLRAYANPLCSATRAELLTGRFGFRTGIGTIMRNHPVVRAGLSVDEVSLADALPEAYLCSAFGKWHLGNKEQFPRHPQDLGFDYFAGTRGNLNIEPVAGFEYFIWRKYVMGEEVVVLDYATTDLAEDVIHFAGRSAGPDFFWIASHAAHSPLHAPPDHLHRARRRSSTARR